MRDRHPLEKTLMEYAKTSQVPEPDREKENLAIHNIIQMVPTDRIRTNSFEFVGGQIQWIRKRTWLLQIAALILLGLLAANHSLQPISNQSYIAVSIAAPVLALFILDDLAKVFRPGMVELELTTVHTVNLVLLSRFLILGISDFLLLLIFTGVTAYENGYELLRFSVYSIVPFLLTSAGILCLMNRYQGEQLKSSVTAISLLMIVLITLCGKKETLAIYREEHLMVWLMIGAVSMGVLVYKGYQLMHRSKEDYSREAA